MPEEELKSPLAKATNNALDHQKKLLHATSDALDAVFTMGCEVGVAEERERIVKWIEENRSAIELEDGVFMYRDRFRSEDIIAFIKEDKEDKEDE
jgi:hypothetical protein